MPFPLKLALAIQAAASTPTAGILYEVWHSRAAQAMALQEQKLTTELVIQSAGALTLDDVYSRGPASDIYSTGSWREQWLQHKRDRNWRLSG
jgi:hypothetical protein